MGLTGVIPDLLAPVQLKPDRLPWPGALNLADLRPLARITVVREPMPRGTREYLSLTDPDGPSQLPLLGERRTMVILGYPIYKERPRIGFFVEALTDNLDDYSDSYLRKQRPSVKDTKLIDLADIGVMPHIRKDDGGQLLWAPRVYAIRTPSSRTIPEPFEDEESSIAGP